MQFRSRTFHATFSKSLLILLPTADSVYQHTLRELNLGMQLYLICMCFLLIRVWPILYNCSFLLCFLLPLMYSLLINRLFIANLSCMCSKCWRRMTWCQVASESMYSCVGECSCVCMQEGKGSGDIKVATTEMLPQQTSLTPTYDLKL